MQCGIADLGYVPEVGEDEQCYDQCDDRRAETDEVDQTRNEMKVVFILQQSPHYIVTDILALVSNKLELLTVTLGINFGYY